MAHICSGTILLMDRLYQSLCPASLSPAETILSVPMIVQGSYMLLERRNFWQMGSRVQERELSQKLGLDYEMPCHKK